MSTLLQCTKLTDGAVSVEIAASSMRPLGSRGVIYNVPLDISTDDLVACLASQGVKFVKRFRFKSSDSSELKDSKSVLLQFYTADLPGEVKIGYLFFRVKRYVPRPSRCSSATAMGMSLVIAEVNCTAQFAVANISIASAALLLKYPSCRGGHSANDKICPRYKRETEILKLKTEKLSYADACKAQNCQKSSVPNMVSQSTFPPLPKKTVG